MSAEVIIPILIALAFAGAIGFVYIQKKKRDAVVPVYLQMPTVGSGWTFVYSNNVSGDASNFDFPQSDGAHYVCTKASGVALGKTITMTFNISGTGELLVADPNDKAPATLRLFLWGQTVNDRWWGDIVTNLTPGDHTVSIAVDPSHWSGVGGNPPVVQDPFTTVVGNLYAMGYTFGGQYFAGHGVYAKGNVHFTLKSYTVA